MQFGRVCLLDDAFRPDRFLPRAMRNQKIPIGLQSYFILKDAAYLQTDIIESGIDSAEAADQNSACKFLATIDNFVISKPDV